MAYPKDLEILNHLADLEELCVDAYSLKQFGDLFSHLKDYFDSAVAINIRSITVNVDESPPRSCFVDGPPYFLRHFCSIIMNTGGTSTVSLSKPVLHMVFAIFGSNFTEKCPLPVISASMGSR